MRLISCNVINGVQCFSCLFITVSRSVARLSWNIALLSSVGCNYCIFNLGNFTCCQDMYIISSLQGVKITCKFTERFLRNQSLCRGTFFGRTLYLKFSMRIDWNIKNGRKLENWKTMPACTMSHNKIHVQTYSNLSLMWPIEKYLMLYARLLHLTTSVRIMHFLYFHC